MEFEEIVRAVTRVIETEHRIAYRALKRRFDLTEDDIEDIKAELIDAKRIAEDENNKVLVARFPNEATGDHAAEVLEQADRRLLTVMFCDIVGSTKMSQRFEPEDLRDLIRRYQKVCGAVVEAYDGHVAQYLGDGLLIYYGYPIALEDEAYCAIRSGLEIMDQLENDTEILQKLGSPMQVRIGIHTGSVVVGEIGAGGRNEHLALGDTPNVAARIQGVAEPGQVVISASTHRLTEGLFHTDPLGQRQLKGVAKEIELFKVHQESDKDSRFEVALSTGRLANFTGREEELSLLEQYWSEAKNGQGRAISMTAEPGFGKTRLAQEFKTRIGDSEARTIVFRCSPYHNTSAYYPLIQMLEQAFEFHINDSPEQRTQKIEAFLANYELHNDNAAAIFCYFLGLPHPDTDIYSEDPRAHRHLLSNLLIDLFMEEAKQRPVFMVWDDLHWADPSTLELLDHYLSHVPGTATLAMIIYRDDFPFPWEHKSFFRALTLNRLSDNEVEVLAKTVAGESEMAQPIVDLIVEKTDGVPLFVEELTRSILDIGLNVLDADLAKDHVIDMVLVPETLQDSLEARIDRCLGGKLIAQWAATIGREFNYEILRRVVDDDVAVNNGINELLDADLIYRSGSISEPKFIFKHALLRDTAYESLLIRKRRQYHVRIAGTLVDFSDFAETEPELIAYHFTEGELLSQAIDWWQRASEYAISRSASPEATGHLHKALAMIGDLPRTADTIKKSSELQQTLNLLTADSQGN